ncbi:hypothetical protein ACHHYP_20030 [Achlya hypogyna]|uniref:EF-hand domain-containing protein n=1 Tax=Achlya hypogyna TaxID=1202772 RepID=A0A1V9ZTV9_ACHHY|nr:hypothetical protein ACHHYP_20030 [Achlya hypogyna]
MKDEQEYWKIFMEIKDSLRTEKHLAAARKDHPFDGPRALSFVAPRGTAATRMEASWKLYDSLSETVKTTAYEAAAAISILQDITHYQRLAEVFREVGFNHDGIVTKDEILASAAKFHIGLSETEAEMLLTFMDRNHDGKTTRQEVDIIVQKCDRKAPTGIRPS